MQRPTRDDGGAATWHVVISSCYFRKHAGWLAFGYAMTRLGNSWLGPLTRFLIHQSVLYVGGMRCGPQRDFCLVVPAAVAAGNEGDAFA